MAVVVKQVAVCDSVDTVVKSVVDAVLAVKSGQSLSSLVGDVLADIQAAPTLVSDVKNSPVAALNSVALGVVQLAEALLQLPAPVVHV